MWFYQVGLPIRVYCVSYVVLIVLHHRVVILLSKLVYECTPYLFAVGGPAEKAGLRKNDIIISVNGQSILHYSHQDVVSLIHHTETPGVWLSVCEPTQRVRGKSEGRSKLKVAGSRSPLFSPNQKMLL